MAFEMIHKDMNYNFQFNRLLSYGESACKKSEVIAVADNTVDFETWYREWKKYAEIAENEKRYMHSMYYYRMAEFFLSDSDPQKNIMYSKMSEMFRKARLDVKYDKVPFKDAYLPCLVMEATNPTSTLLVHGGYDSFIEEFYLICDQFVKVGYNVILFEGEGQGGTLRNGLKFNYKWEDSVSAVIDYFGLDECSLLGISWGGYFALRAAAKEKRIKNVIAFDIMYDGLDVQFGVMGPRGKKIMKFLYSLKFGSLINKIVNRAMSKSAIAKWALEHGMYITGTETPFTFYQNIEKHTLKGIEKEIDQKVLLLAGENDHYIPLSHYYTLKDTLTKATVTGRLFTKFEHGEQHCQVGNFDIALKTISLWLEGQDTSSNIC